jgi:hypothetical protein
MTMRSLRRLFLVVSLCVGVSIPALAQTYPGGTGTGSGTGSTTGTYTSKSYGNGAAIGIGVGAAAAAVGIALYVHHKHSMKANHATVIGCTQVAGEQTTLLDEKEKKVYSLTDAGSSLMSGERVELAGEKSMDSSGKRIFKVRTMTRNLGPCGAEMSLQSGPGLGEHSASLP